MAEFTKRQKQIIRLKNKKRKASIIAKKLGISTQCVYWHLKRIKKKLIIALGIKKYAKLFPSKRTKMMADADIGRKVFEIIMAEEASQRKKEQIKGKELGRKKDSYKMRVALWDAYGTGRFPIKGK